MKRIDLDKILKKIDVKDEDIFSIGETWPEETTFVSGKKEKVRGKFKYYDIKLKDGTMFYLKSNYLSGDLRSIDDIGFKFM